MRGGPRDRATWNLGQELRRAFSLEASRPFALAARRRMRSIQCLKLLRCQCQCQRDGVLLYMRYGTGFRNCNDVTAADGPGQRNSGCRATVCCANTCKRGITQQAGGGAAEWRIGHHRHAVLLAPWQQVIFNAAVADVVRDLICRAAIAVWNTEQVFQLADLEVGHAPGANPPCRA